MRLYLGCKYRKFDPKPQDIGVLGAKTGLKKSIFLGKTRFKVDFRSKYRKIDPNPKYIGVLGAKTGLKKSIFLGKPRDKVDFIVNLRKFLARNSWARLGAPRSRLIVGQDHYPNHYSTFTRYPYIKTTNNKLTLPNLYLYPHYTNQLH